MGSADAGTFKPVVVLKTPEQLQAIVTATSGNFLFDNLTDGDRKTIMDCMTKKEVPKDVTVITQGSEGDFFYVVESGELDVFVDGANEEKAVFHYSAGGTFGELALMYNAPRAATVKTVADSVLWCVDRASFRHVIVASTNQVRKLDESILKGIPLFADMAPMELAQIADCLRPEEWSSGDTVIQESDTDFVKMKFFLVEEGTLVVHIKDEESGVQVVVGTLQAGDFFGEKALLEKKPRAATVITTSTCKLAAMDVAAFERLMGPCHDVMKGKMSSYLTAAEAKAKEA